MKVNLHTPVEEVQIQIIPLIDVVFCILTFFILAALQFTRQEAINVDLPKASTGTAVPNTSNLQLQSQQQILTLGIDAIGQTSLNGQTIQRQQLAENYKNYLKQNPNGILALKVTKSTAYNDVMQMVDLWRQQGGTQISFVVQPTYSSPPTLSLPVIPPFPVNPGAAPVPNTAPVAPINPQSNPNFNLPPNEPIQPLPGQGLNPPPNGVSPVLPQVPAPQTPTKR
ncbi:biopolymer transporter ExbD [Scytonema hofmannii FACHB-248]|uniref:Biopolymer transporter ExbD n=1 Tax=Scytonema hofmannii FACHB-248 TaxID=1842502 RepID=A0ABR8GZ54_9CYAN|nr:MULTISPECIES: biopolymer transporter ExbD [Nostocales]MBD2608286.1 biopolymer transporter ExbD [Scytonema hofmannii FACHB-248]